MQPRKKIFISDEYASLIKPQTARKKAVVQTLVRGECGSLFGVFFIQSQ